MELFFSLAPIVTILSIVISLVILSRKRRILSLASYVLFILVYNTIVGIGFYNLDPQLAFYAELNYLPLFTVSAFIILKSIPDNDQIKLKPFIVLACIVWLLFTTTNSHQFFKERIEWYSDMSRDYDRKIINEDEENKAILKLTWASAFESLLISSLEGRSQSLLITNNPSRYDLSRRDKFYTHFKEYDLKDLPKRYFQMEQKVYYLDSSK